MSKLFAVLVLCAVVGTVVASVADADVESEIPTRKPRKGAALKPARSLGRGYGNQKVVIVPKGDPRARGPVAAPAPVQAPVNDRVIVEAETFDTEADAAAAAAALAAATVAVPATAPAAASVPGATRVLKAGAPAGAGSCLARYNGAAVAAKAAAYQANYKSRGVKYSQPNRQFGITAKFADCSSFVTSILADTGFNCLFAAGRYTSYMNTEIRKRGGYSQSAKVGDIVMWGTHTGLIVKQCSANTWTMVAMGNSGAGRAECKTVDGLKGWGSGGWLGFWTPRA